MRTISLIVLHCSSTREGQDFSVRDIDRWHRARGWKNGCGYHYVIRLDGKIEKGRPEEMIGAHVKNHNKHSIGICYIGGLDHQGRPRDTRTKAQRRAIASLLGLLCVKYPKAVIASHHTLDPTKSCPCFNAEAYNSFRDMLN